MALKDLPDYTREMVIRYEGGFIGLEELAARLGSIVPWDMKGNIVLMEDFESELTEWTDNSDEGCSATRSSRHKFSGDWSAKLTKSNTVGAGTAMLSRYFHFPGLLKYAAFARFSWNTSGLAIRLQLIFDDLTTNFLIKVDYDQITYHLRIITTGGAYHDLGVSPVLNIPALAWYPILITFDLSTGYYDKLYVADEEYDISDVPLFSGASDGYFYGYIDVGTYQASEGERNTYVDDIIIAKNVP